jgi:hypothetical protein
MASAPPANAKRAWPLLLVAGCSFIPGFGLFFGAAAVTWGLVGNRPRAKLGVAIGAAGALLNLAIPMLILAKIQHEGALAQVAVEQTRRDLVELVSQLESYRGRTGRYPPSLQTLVGTPIPLRLVNIYDHSQGLFHLPRVYEYHVAPDRETYDLFSAGPDGVPHTPDDIRPQLPDSVRAGYQPVP